MRSGPTPIRRRRGQHTAFRRLLTPRDPAEIEAVPDVPVVGISESVDPDFDVIDLTVLMHDLAVEGMQAGQGEPC